MVGAVMDGAHLPSSSMRPPSLQAGAVLDLALSAGQVATFEYDFTTGPVWWSGPVSTLLGLVAGDTAGVRTSLTELLQPASVAPAEGRGGAVVLEEQRGERLLRIHLQPSTAPNRWAGALVDISEQQAYSRALDDLVDRYRLLVDLSPDGIVVHQGGRIVYANPAAVRFVGEDTADGMLTSPITDFIHEDSRRDMLSRIAELADSQPGQASEPSEVTVVRRNATSLPMESTSVRTTWQGQPAYQAILRDVSERHAAQRSLRYQAALVRQVSEAIVAVDAAGLVSSWNPAAERIFEQAAKDVLGRPVSAVLPAVLPADGQRAELAHRRRDGERLDLAVSVVGLDGAAGSVIVCSDVTERRRAADALWHEARHDSLTQLANRTQVLEHLSAALGEDRVGETNVVVVLLDLDQFKVLNDSLGHRAGDDILRAIAGRLVGTVRRTDLVARLGGDEFLVISRALDGSVEEWAYRLRSAVSEPLQIGPRRVVLTASAGIVIVAADQAPAAEDVLRDADVAMYQAKAHGRDRHELFSVDQRQRAHRRLDMEEHMRRGIMTDEFTLHFQPVLSVTSGRVVGAEALLRWTSPTFGSVAPVEFIPIAEESGLILALGEWVLRSACAQTACWRKGHAELADMHIAVNVSASQLTDPALVSTVAGILTATGLPPSALRLEITESMLMIDPAASAQVVTELSSLGVKLSIDDFGTGYSSLAYLTRFDVHELKIDRSFVQGMNDVANDLAIVASVIALAHTLGLSVVGEGVETAEQLVALRSLGCDAVQGYYIGRPAAADDVLPKLLTVHADLQESG